MNEAKAKIHNTPKYRFFKKQWEAEALVQGKVWISTLETCRQYENPIQGDPEEAHENYNTGYLRGNGSDEDFVKIANKVGINIDSSSHGCTLNNCSKKTIIDDAYVICTTTEFEPDVMSETYGNYCVKINDPETFFKIITNKLLANSPLKRGDAGPIRYKERDYSGYQPQPGFIGFVKPPRYSPDNEYRFLWVIESSIKITPFLLDCPELIGVCERVR